MITDPQGTILALFIAFCRMGGCVMVLPGFSSARVPSFIRLMVAVAVSMAVLPLLWDTIYPRVSAAGNGYIMLVISETFVGTMFGLIARFYTLGLQFAGSTVAMMIGFNAPGSGDIIEDTAENQLTNMISFAGLMLLFALDFHHVVFRALIDSYNAMPVGGIVDAQKALITLTDTLSATFFIMLRLASPFILYGLLFNVTVGLINKLAPQIPVYFISTPYLLMGGLFMLYLSIAVMVQQFADAFPTVFLGR
ncbi:flagellar type III secretion system protein FliR [Rhizobiaceae bacterium n13]|uniref:Flagellar biosynthetic protein FliR n=1 Tax=Ferirhizobium litorale TaxID=2927786 RepID=A0AAE3QE98_9HYPH|nr:flagellar biosynthetic protein FliR [Fererhizobium litorale]MDI7863425.1 flagellar type III secretion system protein FliR [Fererhizobium litorale]MDI7922298.1 flagellar type III secretion system protein FliR [Fererhizobium litorale]